MEVTLHRVGNADSGAPAPLGKAGVSPSSYLIHPDIFELAGDFALGAWYGGSESAGDFLFSIGGYHPYYKVPAYYPTLTSIRPINLAQPAVLNTVKPNPAVSQAVTQSSAAKLAIATPSYPQVTVASGQGVHVSIANNVANQFDRFAASAHRVCELYGNRLVFLA